MAARPCCSDPWSEGRPYSGGWALQPPPLPGVVEALPEIDFIYLTHEHPDHTDYETLERLFQGCARNATLLVPRFMTDRFARALRESFPSRRLVELKHGKRHRVGAFELRSFQYRNEDSVITVRGADGFTVLNANDAFMKGAPLRQLARLHPRIDVALSQFTISNAFPYAYTDHGTEGTSFPWEKEDLKRYCVAMLRTLQPRCWVPYHSFVRFARPENAYLNAHSCSLDEIVEYVSSADQPSKVIRVFPGERLEGTRHIPVPEAEAHFRSYSAQIEADDPEITPQALDAALAGFERDFRSQVSLLFRRWLRPLGFVVNETGGHYHFDPRASRFRSGDERLRETHSECSWTTVPLAPFAEALGARWGMGNLLISGAIRTTVAPEWRSRDFLFWAVALVRQSGYFDLASLWFLRPRAIGTAIRRRSELLDIVRNSLRANGFLSGNIEPNRLVERG